MYGPPLSTANTYSTVGTTREADSSVPIEYPTPDQINPAGTTNRYNLREGQLLQQQQQEQKSFAMANALLGQGDVHSYPTLYPPPPRTVSMPAPSIPPPPPLSSSNAAIQDPSLGYNVGSNNTRPLLTPLQVPAPFSGSGPPRISTGYSPIAGNRSFSSNNGELPLISSGIGSGTPSPAAGSFSSSSMLLSNDQLSRPLQSNRPLSWGAPRTSQHGSKVFNAAHPAPGSSSSLSQMQGPGRSISGSSLHDVPPFSGLPRTGSNSNSSGSGGSGNINSSANSSSIRRSTARIDPSQMPRPERPLNSSTVLYHTKSGGDRRNPPSSNTAYVAVDTGNCSPRVMRSTMVAPPASKTVLQQVGLPFAVLCTPFADPENGEDPVPQIDYIDLGSNSNSVDGNAGSNSSGQGGLYGFPINSSSNSSSSNSKRSVPSFLPPRCTRCLAYINSAVSWEDAGSSWVCNLCDMSNAVPTWYHSALDGGGHRLDRALRPELQRGSVDFLVNDDYCIRPPQEPVFVFAIDISHKAAATGVTIAAIQAVRVALQQLRALQVELRYQGQPTTSASGAENATIRVGVITFDKEVQYYAFDTKRKNCADTLKIFVSNAYDPVAPLPADKWLLPVVENQNEIDVLLNRIPELIVSLQLHSNFSSGGFGSYQDLATSGIAGSDPQLADLDCDPAGAAAASAAASRDCSVTAAIKTVQLALSAGGGSGSGVGGRLFVITSSHATCGIGKLSARREELGLYGNKDEFYMYGCCGGIESYHQQNSLNSATAVSSAAAAVTTAASSAASGVGESATSIFAAAAALITGDKRSSNNSILSSSRNGSRLQLNNVRTDIGGSNGGTTSNKQQQLVSKAAQQEQQLLEEFTFAAAEYQTLADECAGAMLAVNVLVCVGEQHHSGAFTDTALLFDVAQATGGKAHFVLGAMTEEHNVQRLEQQLICDIESLRASEVVIKLRTSVGLSVESCSGPGHFTELQGEVECCSVDSESSFMFTLMHDPNHGAALKEDDKVYVQLAVLYTSPSRQRRIRVHNLTMIASLKHQLIYRNSDIEAVVVAFMKQALKKALMYPLHSGTAAATGSRNSSSTANQKDLSSSTGDSRNARDFLQNTVTDVLYNYRNHCSPQSPRGQLILPESLKVLPVYVLGMLKHPSLQENRPVFSSSGSGSSGALHQGGNSTPSLLTAGQRFGSSGALTQVPLTPTYGPALGRVFVRAHERAFEIRRLLCCPITEVINSLYPRLYNLLSLLSEEENMDASAANGSDTKSAASDASDYSIGPPGAYVSTEGSCDGVVHRNSRRGMTMLASTLSPSAEVFESDQIFLLDDRSVCYLYVGRTVVQSLIDDLFVTTNTPYGPEEYVAAQMSTVIGRRFQAFLELLRSTSTHKQELKVLWAGLNTNNPLMNKFSMRLIEDSNFGHMSYVDFLCSLHTKIQAKL